LLLENGTSVGFGDVREVLTSANIEKVYGVHTHDNAELGYSLDGVLR
jgi:hypothetical protein